MTGRSCGFLSARSGSACPACKGRMFDPMLLSSENEEVATAGRKWQASAYTIKDDLWVSPAPSLLSGITLLAHCGVQDLSVLERKTVKIGKEEVYIDVVLCFSFFDRLLPIRLGGAYP